MPDNSVSYWINQAIMMAAKYQKQYSVIRDQYGGHSIFPARTSVGAVCRAIYTTSDVFDR